MSEFKLSPFCFCVFFVGEVFLLQLKLQTFLSRATAAEWQHTGTPFQRTVVIDSDFVNPCCSSEWKVGCGRLTAVFNCHLQEQFITLCLSFVLYSPVVHTENENAIDSQVVLLSGERKGAPWGVKGVLPQGNYASAFSCPW